MRKFEFTEDEVKQLSHESIYHEHHVVRRRMQALLLKSQGLEHKKIAKILNINQSTLRSYFDLYLQGGVEALKKLHYRGKSNLLREKRDQIIVYLEEHPPSTLKEAQIRIKDATGLKRSLTQVSKFLKENGIIVHK